MITKARVVHDPTSCRIPFTDCPNIYLQVTSRNVDTFYCSVTIKALVERVFTKLVLILGIF